MPSHPQDLYLSPHSDDVCFSLGALSQRRGSGILLTLCSRSGYTAQPGSPRSPEAVTDLRRAEDRAFAAAIGLTPMVLSLSDAALEGLHPFDLHHLPARQARLGPAILEAIRSLVPTSPVEPRPWLFCPIGIGGHLDHVATRWTVSAHLPLLAPHFRLAFYEDLPYASRTDLRQAWVADLQRSLPHLSLRRITLPLGPAAITKLALLGRYPSQFRLPPTSLEAFSPGIADAEPHEALWTAEDGREFLE